MTVVFTQSLFNCTARAATPFGDTCLFNCTAQTDGQPAVSGEWTVWWTVWSHWVTVVGSVAAVQARQKIGPVQAAVVGGDDAGTAPLVRDRARSRRRGDPREGLLDGGLDRLAVLELLRPGGTREVAAA